MDRPVEVFCGPQITCRRNLTLPCERFDQLASAPSAACRCINLGKGNRNRTYIPAFARVTYRKDGGWDERSGAAWQHAQLGRDGWPTGIQRQSSAELVALQRVEITPAATRIDVGVGESEVVAHHGVKAVVRCSIDRFNSSAVRFVSLMIDATGEALTFLVRARRNFTIPSELVRWTARRQSAPHTALCARVLEMPSVVGF